jgi:DMSO/TMAO reductase YedYZ molybdopterin-dependent catalytic subunit
MHRRAFLSSSSFAALGALVQPARIGAALADAFLQPPCAPDPFAGGTRLGTLPLSAPGAIGGPLETMIGRGLDARLMTDLSMLTPETLVTPNDRHFVRTTSPDRIDPSKPWAIEVGGRVARPLQIRPADLLPQATTRGPILIECAGNSNPANFGLMSAARWDGVPLLPFVERAGPTGGATRVLVEGFDEHSTSSSYSSPGASWVFTLEQLASTGAFLAVRMNGEALPPDHGFPVRLVVPGWYGCASIKWVTAVTVVDDEVPATPHMVEFATRTHQQGRPPLARNFEPAEIDHAAMPVRVERWRVDGQPLHRIIGIAWGGRKPLEALTIRFNRNEEYQPVSLCPPPVTSETWTLWTHAWKPARPGRYQIVLRVPDESVRTRRLDVYFYVREVWIEDI